MSDNSARGHGSALSDMLDARVQAVEEDEGATRQSVSVSRIKFTNREIS